MHPHDICHTMFPRGVHHQPFVRSCISGRYSENVFSTHLFSPPLCIASYIILFLGFEQPGDCCAAQSTTSLWLNTEVQLAWWLLLLLDPAWPSKTGYVLLTCGWLNIWNRCCSADANGHMDGWSPSRVRLHGRLAFSWRWNRFQEPAKIHKEDATQ